MKAALNGALNLSILDGWWDEWYDGENGWAIPTADGVSDPDRRDDLEAAALYDLIERSVATTFYDTDAEGRPARWISMLRHTLSTLGPKVLSSRMVREYVTELYDPAVQSSRLILADGAAEGRRLASYESRVMASWRHVEVQHVEAVGSADAPQRGDKITVRAQVQLDGLDPAEVVCQLVAGRVDHNDLLVEPRLIALEPVLALGAGQWRFESEIELDRNGAFGYTVRVLPVHDGLVSAAELGLQALPPTVVAPADGEIAPM
jgi:starch phosphorylase